jgi:AraC-like DNA-binding protein
VTVRALSLKVGMNRNKLFYGFKSLFGVSLFQHLQDRRIEEGHRLLTTTEQPVGEIAARVGFRHQCNFSTAFRARYGFAPSALRKPSAGRA